MLVEQDSYYRNLADMPLDERHQANFDHPDSHRQRHAGQSYSAAKAGSYESRCRCMILRRTRAATEIEIIEPRPVVIVEGISYLCGAASADLLDVRVFVDTPDDIRLMRRLKRDIAERGRTVESDDGTISTGRSGRCISSSSSRQNGTRTSSSPRAGRRASASSFFAAWSAKN